MVDHPLHLSKIFLLEALFYSQRQDTLESKPNISNPESITVAPLKEFLEYFQNQNE